MATITTTGTGTGGDVVSVIRIGPRGLDHFLRAIRNRSGNPRIKCDGRSILLVSPGPPHERASELLGAMVNVVVSVLGIPSRMYGSTFYRLPDEQKGFEPDKSYYIRNVERVRTAQEIDLRVCPPPDLVIEVVNTHSPAHALRVCRALRVPEVWLYDVPLRRFSLLLLEATGEGKFRYAPGPRSLAFPFLTAEEIAPWAGPTSEDDGVFIQRARAWAEAELTPRYPALRAPENG